MWYQFSNGNNRIASVLIAMLMLALVCFAPAGMIFAEDIARQNSNGGNAEGGDGLKGSESSGDATVTTGDAASEVDVENTVNTNTVDTSTSSDDAAQDTGEASDGSTDVSTDTSNEAPQADLDTSDVQETGTSTPELLVADEPIATTTLSVENSNTATSTTSATSTAMTGENEASAGTGTASVETGDSYAFANVVNAVNSNFVGSDGSFQLLNLFGNLFGEISLTMENGAGCSFLCFLTELFVSNHNNAYVENNIAVSAFTGLNAATSTSGDAGIATGNAFAAANVVNVVNTNVINSDYLAFIMNAFGSWEGDLVLPPGSFFDGLANSQQGACCQTGDITAENQNDADIENNARSGADSGGNSASGSGSAAIDTGMAGAASNVMTIANTNIFGNNLLLIYVRTLGQWQGHVFSLPDGVNIIGMRDGFIIDGFSSHIAPGASGAASTAIRNENRARIINNVSAAASTGGNTAAAGGDASVSTGNAYAAANVVNIANTNIIGRNWLFAIVNVFGNWMGDVAFGRPDLWVGASAEGPSPLQDGADAQFTLTYRNNGTAPATQSELTFNFGENLKITDAGGGMVKGNTILFDAGAINPGASGSFSFAAKVQGAPLGNSQAIVFASADMFEDDGNTSNNTDELRLDFYNKPPEGFLGYNQIYARLEIAKERKGANTAPAGSGVDYAITIENKGAGYAYNAAVTDEIKNASGETISTQTWNLDTVYPGEKVVIDYTVAFAENTPPGEYKNYALAKWYDEIGNYVDHSGHASASVTITKAQTADGASSNDTATSSPEAIGSPTSDTDGIGGSLDDAPATTIVAETSEANASEKEQGSDEVVFVGGQEADDILAGENPTLVTDFRPLDTQLRDELLNNRRKPWDPRSLFANIAFSGMSYVFMWVFAAAFIIYFISRKRKNV